jgi:hypothetical protein
MTRNDAFPAAHVSKPAMSLRDIGTDENREDRGDTLKLVREWMRSKTLWSSSVREQA